MKKIFVFLESSQATLRALCLSVVFLQLPGCFLGEAPASDDQKAEIADRFKLQNQFQEILGVYEGAIEDRLNGENDIPVELEIFSVDEPSGRNDDGETIMVPVLKGYLKRLDRQNESSDWTLDFARYYPDRDEITLQSQPSQGSQIPGAGRLSIQGDILDGMIDAEVEDQKGYFGRLRAALKSE